VIEDERLAAVVWGIVALSVLVALNLVGSRAGRAMRAIATSEATAAAAGINVAMYKLRLFVLAAGLAGLAGGLFAYYLLFLSPDAFPLIMSITFVVMVAVGGIGSVYGAVVGAVAVTYLEDKLRELGAREELLGYDLPAQAPQVFSVGVFGAILIVVMLFMPGGLLPGLRAGATAAARRLRAT
jgi:branched-chain amino acid transport system permease protein